MSNEMEKEITEIGCLVWCWNKTFNERVIGTLIGIRESQEKPYFTCFTVETNYKHCRPVKKDELRFAEVSKTIDHIGDTTEKDHICQEGKMAELVQKLYKLENENEKLIQNHGYFGKQIHTMEREKKQLEEEAKIIKILIQDVYDPESIDGRTVMKIRELFKEYKK